MLFLAPIMLAGLGAIAVPVVIHLMDRSKTEAVDWPSLRFLRVARQRAARRSRLKNWLVLLARCLMLALLAVAMAKPYRSDDSWDKPHNQPTTVVLVLDNSYSMGYRETPETSEGPGPRSGPAMGGGEAGTRFERAKGLALQQLSTLKLDDEVALVLANEQATVLTERPTRDREEVRKLIEAAKLSDRGTDMGAALTAAFAVGHLDATTPNTPTSDATTQPSTLSPVKPPRDAWRNVMVFTDMQLSGWRAVTDDKLLDKAAAPLPVTVVDMSGSGSANRFIRQVKVSDQSTGGNLIVEAEVAGQDDSSGSASEGGGQQVSLWIDGRKIGAPETVPPGSTKATLRTTLPSPGVHACMVSVEEDRLPIDDRTWFAINVTGGGHITVVDGDPSTVPTLAETYFLNAALDLIHAKNGTPTVDPMTPDQLSTTPIPRGGGLILCNVPRLDGSALNHVENFLRSGGSVLVTLGDKIDIAHYNRDWHFLPIKLDRILGDANRSRSYSILLDQPEHPIFGNILDLSATRYFAFVGADPTSLRNNGKLLASFSNGSPFLIEGTFGGSGDPSSPAGHGGTVLLMTGAIDADWSNLPYRRAFVPLVDRMASYLTRQRMSSRSVVLGQPVRFTGPGTLDRKSIKITSPDGTMQVLTAALDTKSGQAVAEFRDTQRVGVYRIDADEGFNTGGAFAVNLDTKESILTPLGADDLRKAFGKHPLRVISSGAGTVGSWDLDQSPELTRKRTEYWPWLVLAAFVVFMIETMLANYFTRRRRPIPPPTTEYLGTRRTEAMAGGVEAA